MRYLVILAVLLAGCAGSQRVVQNGELCESYGEDDLRLFRSTFQPKPITCPCTQLKRTKLQKPGTNWYGKEVDFHADACPMPSSFARLDSQIDTTPHFQPAVLATLAPEILRAAALVGGMYLLGSQIRSGLVNQPVGQPLAGSIRVSTANFSNGDNPIPGVVP